MVSKLFQYEKQQRGCYYQLSWFSAWIILATTERSENSHVGVTNITGAKVLSTDIPVSSTESALPSYQTPSSSPRGSTPLYKPCMYVPPQRVGFLPRFSLKTGIDFAHFGLESRTVIEGTTGLYERVHRFNSKWGRKKDREKYLNSKLVLRNVFVPVLI